MLILAILAVLCGASGWTEVRRFGQAKRKWLKTFLTLPHGIPSRDTFGRLFAAPDPTQLARCFLNWTASLAQGSAGKRVAIAGKTIRRSFDRASRRAAIPMVSAFAQPDRLVLGPLAVEDKSNEITTLPQLLKLLELEGATVPVDAMHRQKDSAEAIRQAKADHLMQVKANQPSLHEDVKLFFDEAIAHRWQDTAHAFHETIEKGHGRIEIRRCWSTWDVDWLKQRADGPGLRSLACVEAQRQIAGKVSPERRYDLGSGAGRGAAIARIDSPSHALHLEDLGAHQHRVTLRDGETRMDRDIVLQLELARDPEPSVQIEHGIDAARYVAVSLVPEFEADPVAQGAAADVVFLLDCSASMDGPSIVQACHALELCLRTLSEGDRFNVCRFGSTYEWMCDEPRVYSRQTLEQALAWLSQVQADLGGTEMLPVGWGGIETSADALFSVRHRSDVHLFHSRAAMSLLSDSASISDVHEDDLPLALGADGDGSVAGAPTPSPAVPRHSPPAMPCSSAECVMAILDAQEADGSFGSVDPRDCGFASALSWGHRCRAVSELRINDVRLDEAGRSSQRLRLVRTAVLLVHLQHDYADHRRLWERAYAKACRYLALQLGTEGQVVRDVLQQA